MGSQWPRDLLCPPPCPSWAHPKGHGHTEGNMEEPENICTGCQSHLAWQCLVTHSRAAPSNPSPQCCPGTGELPGPAAELGTSHSSHPHGPSTHNVRSLGMWLKLDTGMEVILLLFRVLQEGRKGQVRAARPKMAA